MSCEDHILLKGYNGGLWKNGYRSGPSTLSVMAVNRELDDLLIGIMHASMRDWIIVSLSLGIIVCHQLDMTIAVDWDAKPQTNQSKSLSVIVAPPYLIHGYVY